MRQTQYLVFSVAMTIKKPREYRQYSDAAEAASRISELPESVVFHFLSVKTRLSKAWWGCTAKSMLLKGTQMIALTHTLSQRIARFLERRGLLERDTENTYLVFE